MPLQDVSGDPSMIGWLRQAGHGHLLSNEYQQQDQHHYSNLALSPSLPIIPAGHSRVDPYHESYNRSPSFSPVANFNTQSYDGRQNSPNFYSAPTQFLAPHMNQHHVDVDIENMRRDPNTRVIQRPPGDDVVYRQRVFVKYLQPPTPPVGGAIIVRERQPPAPPPDPPLVIRRAPPPPPTPPPVVIRERPPQLPPPEGTTIINKIIPSPPKPQRQVIIEQFPQLPPKPRDVILEKWLPTAPRQRRIFYERLPVPFSNQPAPTRPIIIQHGQPRVHVQRQIITAPGQQHSYQHASSHSDINHVLSQIGGLQHASSHTDINQILSQIGANQHIYSPAYPSSHISYNPYPGLQHSYSTTSHPQSNVVIMQNGQPTHGAPLSCVCSQNPMVGLAAYGPGISTMPNIGHYQGQSTVYNVPEHVPIDSILHQFGIDLHSAQRSTDPHSAVAHVWDAASHVNPPHSIDPRSAVSHVWNAASHVNPPHSLDPHSAVSHVWNAAAHAVDHSQLGLSSTGHAWNNMGHYH